MMKKIVPKFKNTMNWIIRQSWFFSLSLFLGLMVIGKIDNGREFLATLILCLIFLGIGCSFFKKTHKYGVKQNIKTVQKRTRGILRISLLLPTVHWQYGGLTLNAQRNCCRGAFL